MFLLKNWNFKVKNVLHFVDEIRVHKYNSDWMRLGEKFRQHESGKQELAQVIRQKHVLVALKMTN